MRCCTTASISGKGSSRFTGSSQRADGHHQHRPRGPQRFSLPVCSDTAGPAPLSPQPLGGPYDSPCSACFQALALASRAVTFRAPAHPTLPSPRCGAPAQPGLPTSLRLHLPRPLCPRHGAPAFRLSAPRALPFPAPHTHLPQRADGSRRSVPAPAGRGAALRGGPGRGLRSLGLA